MFVKITHSNTAGLIEGNVINVPSWVGRDLVRRNLAEVTAFVPSSKIVKREKLEKISFVKKTAKLRSKTKVSAYMATFPERFESMLVAVGSLLPQVDYLHLWCNGYDLDLLSKLDKSITDKKLIVHTANEIEPQIDLGCLGKFVLSESWNGYVLTVDDDFIYAGNFVKTLIEGIDRHDRKAIISIHGRTVKNPIKSYTRDWVNFWQCRQTIEQDKECHIIGTGVMALHTDCLSGKPIVLNDVFDRTNTSDILFSIEMQKRKIPMVVIAHDANIVKWIQNKKSIGKSAHADDTNETELVNSINWRFQWES